MINIYNVRNTEDGSKVLYLKKVNEGIEGEAYLGFFSLKTKCRWTLGGKIINAGMFKKDGLDLVELK